MAQDTLISQMIEQDEGNEYYKNFKFDYSDGILEDHNKEPYEKIVKGLVTGNKVLFEQATGTGKSYLALKFLHDHAKGKRVLFVSPSNTIKDLFTDSYNNWLGEDYCQFDTCLYQGLKSKQNKHYDIIIFDEVHRMGAKTWGSNAEILMNNNPNATILGMTATLDRPDGVDVRRLYFDNKPSVSVLTLVDALERGILPKPDYTLAKVDFKDDSRYIDSSIREFKEKLKQAEGEEKKQILDYLEKLKRAKQYIAECKDIPQIFANEITTNELKQGKFIVFCPAGEDEDENNESIHRMKTIMKQAEKWFKGVEGIKGVTKYSVYTKQSAKQNAQIIKDFENDKTESLKLLFSINMLNEGKHVKDIDGVIMLRSTSSRTIYLQQLGRALSVGHGKQPKIFDFVANLKCVDVTEIEQIATTVNKATAVNNAANEGRQRGRDVNRTEENLDFKLTVENLSTMKFIDTLKSDIFAFNHQNDFKFEDFCNRLLAYKKQFGNCLVPYAYNCKDGYPLGQKVQNIRRRDIILNEEQKQIITNVGFVWKVRGIDSDNVRMSIKQIVNDINAFINENGKMPRYLDDRKTQEERDEDNLRKRFNDLKRNSNGAEKKYIEDNLIKVEEKEEVRDCIVKVVQDVNAFINENGEMPRFLDNPKNQEEQDEGNLRNRLNRLKRNSNDAEKKYIEDNLIKVEEKEEVRDCIVKVVQDVNAFINENGKMPRFLDNPKTQEERDQYNLRYRLNRLKSNSNDAEKKYIEDNLIKVKDKIETNINGGQESETELAETNLE